MTTLQRLVKDRRFQWFIIGIILVNAAVLGLMTLGFPPGVQRSLELIDGLCLVIFCIEIALKLAAFGPRFFRDGWNLFDLVVVGIALLPDSGGLSVLRALRVLRLLRLATAVPSMRRVINGMFAALPGGASVAGVLFIMYYVAAIIGVTLFSKTVPQHFGDIGTTFFTLFKMMTLEGWPDIATVVIEQHPRAWIFFVVFIIFTTFTTLNLLFGIIVDAMEKAKEDEVREVMAEQGVEVTETSPQMRIAVIEDEVRHMRAVLDRMEARQGQT
ncbi:MAG: ion transporter [Gemmobacter sp.]